MKQLSFLAVAGLLVGNIASAMVNPNWERPIMGSKLTEIAQTKPVPGLKAFYLTLNQRDSAKEPTSFTMTEDTGVRCITTPCPSSREVEFKITGILSSIHNTDVVRYEAVEVLKNIPPHVRIAPRHLNVTESSMELVAPGGGGFMRRTMWEVEVTRFSSASTLYHGNPEPLASIALE